MMDKALRLSDMKFNRELPVILREMENHLYSIVRDHDRRGVKDSSSCLSALLREAFLTLTQLSELRLNSDVEAIKLYNGIIGRTNISLIMERQEKTITGVISGQIIPVLNKVLHTISGNHDEVINTLRREAPTVKTKARHTVEILVLEEEIANKGVVISPINTNDFHFINNSTMRKNFENDIEELNNSITNRDIKMILINSGSITEALLLDSLLHRENEAMNTVNKGKGDLRKWGLEDIINVAEELSIITDLIAYQAHLLRKYRNIVHPGKQVRKSIAIKPEDADIAVNILRNIILSLGGKL